ncbi:MAG TPA: SpoIIE family protein phosphatase [Vicinamibacterales bacterium]|nr:SpoIIE family protein phosphatase [Vicinamibacterales bacterium]
MPGLVLPNPVASSASPADPARTHILIVDDDEDMRILLTARLEEIGYKVSAVPDGEASLEWLEHSTADVMFLDLAMTGMSGLEVLRHIRERGFEVSVILTTAHGSEDVAVEALRTGADDYLRKPFDHYDLQAVLGRTIHKLALTRQNVLLRRQLGFELSRAAKIQADLLPGEYRERNGWQLAARCVPARTVGGDYYDWEQLNPGLLSLTFGDVMGKGISAALLMASVRASLRVIGRHSPPAAAMQTVASSLASDLTRSGAFITLFHAQLDLTTGLLRYVDAGHGYVLMCRADGRIENLPASCLPLGVLDEEVYIEGLVTLFPGDVLLIYSDGLPEARPDLFEPGTNLLAPLGLQSSATAIAEYLIDQATSPGPLTDDLTVVVLRRPPLS